MHVRDMRSLEPGTVLEADLAIIGSGPAGLSIAREFFGSHIRVLLLECGGLAEPQQVAPSEGFENAGASRVSEPRLVRNRVFGGTSHSWSGKCRTFDDIDFEHSDVQARKPRPTRNARRLPWLLVAALLMAAALSAILLFGSPSG